MHTVKLWKGQLGELYSPTLKSVKLYVVVIPKPARREASVAGEVGLPPEAVRLGGKLVGAALAMLLTTAGEPGPRSMRLSSVASLRT